jgi:LTXXQ motif family protein
MKKRTVILGGVAAVVLLTGGWAYAQSTGFGPMFMHGPGGMGPGMMHGMMAGRMGPGMMHGMMGPGMMGGGQAFTDPARMDALKADLAIKPEQEAAWNKYATALKDTAETMKAAFETVGNDLKDAGPQDHFAQMTKFHELGQTQFNSVEAAANELLATLDDAQKVKAQESLPGLAFGPGVMRGRAGGPPFWN